MIGASDELRLSKIPYMTEEEIGDLVRAVNSVPCSEEDYPNLCDACVALAALRVRTYLDSIAV